MFAYLMGIPILGIITLRIRGRNMTGVKKINGPTKSSSQQSIRQIRILFSTIKINKEIKITIIMFT